MSKMNISVYLNTYSDSRGTNSPNLQNFKWNRQINGVQVENATSQAATIPANGSLDVFTTGTKKLVYLETSAECQVTYNGAADPEVIKPIVINSSVLPGISLKTSDITSMTITNPSTTESITVFIATVE